MVTARLLSVELDDLNSAKISTATIKAWKAWTTFFFFNPFFFLVKIFSLLMFSLGKKIPSLYWLLKGFPSLSYLYNIILFRKVWHNKDSWKIKLYFSSSHYLEKSNNQNRVLKVMEKLSTIEWYFIWTFPYPMILYSF